MGIVSQGLCDVGNKGLIDRYRHHWVLPGVFKQHMPEYIHRPVEARNKGNVNRLCCFNPT